MFKFVKIFQPTLPYQFPQRVCGDKDLCREKGGNQKHGRMDRKIVEPTYLLFLNTEIVGVTSLTALKFSLKSRFHQNVSQCVHAWTFLGSEVLEAIQCFGKKDNKN